MERASSGQPASAQPLPAPPLPQVAPPPGRRGLYMALGSVATILVLVAAVIEGPKLFKSGSTDAQTAAAPVPTPVASPATAVPLAAQPAPAVPIQAAQPVPTASQQAIAVPAPALARQTVPAAQAANQPAAQTSRPAIAQPSPQRQTPQQAPQQGAQPAVQQQAVPQAAPQPAVQPPASAPAPAVAVQARPAPPSPELNELRERYNLVSIRASTAKAGLGSMEQQMARQGLNLRGDIREAHTRMDYMLQESMASLRAGDVEGGKRNLQMAERALETIEKFLGR